MRPDLIGAIVIWHEGGSFTQVAYFTSEEEARKNEQPMTDNASYQRFTEFCSTGP